MPHDEQPVANGIRTDHPVPNLPFVDDSHIPIEDPEAIERIGRNNGTDMWGRCDDDSRTGEWMAFTTDPQNHAYAWTVRYHPDHGRSVLLYRGRNASGAYDEWFGDRALLLRLGGYWWNGETWYRPRQILNWASENYLYRPVEHPTTITAADLLDTSCKPALGELRKLLRFDPDTVVTDDQWRHDLALWAARRRTQANPLPLNQCVVTLNAPELTSTTMLGVDELAKEAGIAASTLRAYIARGEADVPLHQITDGNQKRWSRPVARDWVERRRRDPGNAAAVLSGNAEENLAPGLRTLWKRLSESLFGYLWDGPDTKRRWSRPHRNEQSVRSVAEHMGWIAALQLDATVPDEITDIIEYAVLWELSRASDFVKTTGYIAITPAVGQILGWYLRRKPERAARLFGAIVGHAERRLSVSPEVTEKSLRKALVLDGGFDNDRQLKEFLDSFMPPSK